MTNTTPRNAIAMIMFIPVLKSRKYKFFAKTLSLYACTGLINLPIQSNEYLSLVEYVCLSLVIYKCSVSLINT